MKVVYLGVNPRNYQKRAGRIQGREVGKRYLIKQVTLWVTVAKTSGEPWGNTVESQSYLAQMVGELGYLYITSHQSLVKDWVGALTPQYLCPA